MGAEIEDPTMTFPGVLEALTTLRGSVADGGIPDVTRYLVDVRASQINGCCLFAPRLVARQMTGAAPV